MIQLGAIPKKTGAKLTVDIIKSVSYWQEQLKKNPNDETAKAMVQMWLKQAGNIKTIHKTNYFPKKIKQQKPKTELADDKDMKDEIETGDKWYTNPSLWIWGGVGIFFIYAIAKK